MKMVHQGNADALDTTTMISFKKDNVLLQEIMVSQYKHKDTKELKYEINY